MIKLVIFDWDGTLFDSIDGICRSMLAAGVKAKAPERNSDHIKNVIGLGLSEAINTVWPESLHLTPKIIEYYKAIYVAQDQKAPLAYKGVESILENLKRDGYLLAVATGKSRKGLDRVMSNTGTQDLFVDSRCADETLSKPDPLMLNELLQSLDVSVDEAIMIGDTEYDLSMAKKAKMRSIGVSYGAHEAHRLHRHNPIAVVDCFTKIDEIIRGI